MTPKQTRDIPHHSSDMKSQMRKEGLMAIQNNNIDGFWDDSRHTLDWKLTQGEKNLLRGAYQYIVLSGLNRGPVARKQRAKSRLCIETKTSKPSPVVLSLRSRRRAGDDSSGSGAAPAQPQTTVAGDECEAEDDGLSVWDTPSSLTPKATGHWGRDKVRIDEPAIRARNDVTFDACVDIAVRGVDRTDDQVSDSGNGNGTADDYNHGH
ncbi:regulated by snt2 1 [Fusarium agapanthi]|uniref:Regulated by snt2 1 n=1 Tax=Fusarium agapanthi TaxID=1803897 RepID=A0A9P5BIB1_9HYPO|nr:regulated by snt2 1 [Fusarium agapanthi]